MSFDKCRSMTSLMILLRKNHESVICKLAVQVIAKLMTFHLPVTVQRQGASFVFVVNFMEPDHMTGAIFDFCEIPPP
jgi:hypothetical protein